MAARLRVHPPLSGSKKNDIAEAKATERAHAMSCVLSETCQTVMRKMNSGALVIMDQTCRFHSQTKRDKVKQM